MLKEITAKDNNLIKLIRSLHTANGRKKHKLFFTEGLRIVKDTTEYVPDMIEFIVMSVSFCEDNAGYAKEFEKNFFCYRVPDKLFESISDTQSPQGILAVLKYNHASVECCTEERKILILDCIQDPGNMGTIIRTAEAMGINSVFLTKGSADVYSPKVLRSAMGSVFRMNICYIEAGEDIKNLKEAGYKLYSAALGNNSINLREAQISEKLAIVIGNEANGISDEILSMSDCLIKIPMSGKIESLNAAAAAAIIMYHFAKI